MPARSGLSDPVLRPSSGQRRPRPIKSCLACRSKKLRCDRRLPCGQCQKSLRSNQCSYPEDRLSLGSPSTPQHAPQLRPLTWNANPATIRSPREASAAAIPAVHPSINNPESPEQAQQYNTASTPYSDVGPPVTAVEEIQEDGRQAYEGLKSSRSLVKLVSSKISLHV
jgi:hypothetical protein